MSNKYKALINLLLVLSISLLTLNACSGNTHTHQYENGNVIKAPTCTEEGTQELICACGKKQQQTIAAKHSNGEWVVVKAATCAKEGEKYAICSKCNYKTTASIAKSSTHSYDKGKVTKSPTCTNTGTKTVTCTVCGITDKKTVSALGHKLNSAGKCTKCGHINLEMTDTEIEEAKTIEKLSYSVYEYSDKIDITLQFKDANSYSVQVPAYVKIKIEDEYGNALYSDTLIKKSSQDKVTISYDKIKNAETNIGTLYYTVENDYVSFSSISEELEKIPWSVPIDLPNVPKTISDSGYQASSCRITDITYKVNDDDVTFYFTGEKTFDEESDNYSQSCKIGWKLYDEDDYVVDDGVCYTSAITVGEKFKNEEACAYGVIERGKSYRLVIMDVD